MIGACSVDSAAFVEAVVSDISAAGVGSGRRRLAAATPAGRDLGAPAAGAPDGRGGDCGLLTGRALSLRWTAARAPRGASPSTLPFAPSRAGELGEIPIPAFRTGEPGLLPSALALRAPVPGTRALDRGAGLDEGPLDCGSRGRLTLSRLGAGLAAVGTGDGPRDFSTSSCTCEDDGTRGRAPLGAASKRLAGPGEALALPREGVPLYSASSTTASVSSASRLLLCMTGLAPWLAARGVLRRLDACGVLDLCLFGRGGKE